MYVGRIVAVGKTLKSNNVALYRVSSRSFPNRKATKMKDKVVIVPREGSEDDLKKNPYISYNAIRVTNGFAVASNGSHTDPITEKIEMGYPPRDALTISLHALDFEHDDLDTPRIAAIVPVQGDHAWLGIVRKDALLVKSVNIKAGEVIYLATYNLNDVDSEQISGFDAQSADEAAKAIVEQGVFVNLENPVAAAAAIEISGQFIVGSHMPSEDSH